VNVVEGDLTFTRSPGKDGQDGLATFAVAGTLTKAQVTKPGSPFVEKGIRHVVTGKQAYDPALREWAWGSWTIDTSSQTFANGEQAGAMQGTIQVRFERLAAAPTTKPK
jgi:hypothetical protein